MGGLNQPPPGQRAHFQYAGLNRVKWRVCERERVERDTIIVLVLVAKCDEQGMDKACAIEKIL